MGRTSLFLALVTIAGCRPEAYATIGSPDDGATYARGDAVFFQGEVNSDEPLGIEVQGDWRWTSNLDGDLGDRAAVDRTDLRVGEHMITLRVRNAREILLRDQVTIRIVP